MAPTTQQPAALASRSMRAGDIWAGPSGARWLVFQVSSDGIAHLRRVCINQSKGRKYLSRPVLVRPTWTLLERGD